MLAPRHRWISLFSILPFALLVSGCDLSLEIIAIRMLDFDSSRIEGASIWRLSEVTGDFERVSDVPFTRAVFESGEEGLSYPVHDDSGQELTLWAEFTRELETPSIVTVRFWWRRTTDVGVFKVSTFNAAGQSPLSERAAEL
jgi:hypothetical protein